MAVSAPENVLFWGSCEEQTTGFDPGEVEPGLFDGFWPREKRATPMFMPYCRFDQSQLLLLCSMVLRILYEKYILGFWP